MSFVYDKRSIYGKVHLTTENILLAKVSTKPVHYEITYITSKEKDKYLLIRCKQNQGRSKHPAVYILFGCSQPEGKWLTQGHLSPTHQEPLWVNDTLVEIRRQHMNNTLANCRTILESGLTVDNNYTLPMLTPSCLQSTVKSPDPLVT